MVFLLCITDSKQYYSTHYALLKGYLDYNDDYRQDQAKDCLQSKTLRHENEGHKSKNDGSRRETDNSHRPYLLSEVFEHYFRRHHCQIARRNAKKHDQIRIFLKKFPHKLPVHLKPENNMAQTYEQCENKNIFSQFLQLSFYHQPGGADLPGFAVAIFIPLAMYLFGPLMVNCIAFF